MGLVNNPKELQKLHKNDYGQNFQTKIPKYSGKWEILLDPHISGATTILGFTPKHKIIATTLKDSIMKLY